MNPNRKLLLWIVGILPVLFFGFVTIHYSVNAPWFDDFDPFPDFLRKWILSNSFSEKLFLLFQPNNEHRMVFGKGIAIVYYLLTGKLNFTFLHFAGFLFTLGTLYLLWKAFRSTGLLTCLFLPIPFLLFQLQYYLIFLWAICGLQHQPVVFFVCLSMLLMARPQSGRTSFGLAILAGFCANFAMSNGIFVWVGGATILLFQSRYQRLLLWCLSGATAIGLYFYGMSAQGNDSSIDFFFKNPHLSFLGFFAFLGGLFDIVPDRIIQVRTALPIVMAMLIMVWVVIWLLNLKFSWLRVTFHKPKVLPAWLTRFQFRPGQETMGYFSLGVMLFLLSNAAVIGLLRPRFGFFVMVVSNYKIYPAIFLIISYLSFLASTDEVLRRRGFQVAMVASTLIWALTLVHYGPTISERRKYLLVNAYNQQNHAFGLGFEPNSAAAAYIDSLMHFMTQRGIYHYPTEFDLLFAQMKTIQKPLDSLQFSINQVKDGLLITEPMVMVPGGDNTGAYVFFKNGKEPYVFKMNQRRYWGRNLLLHYDKGLEVTVPYAAIPAGTYQWGVLIKGSDSIEAGLIGNITVPE